MISLKDWAAEFDSIGLSAELQAAYLQYIKRLYENKLPVIFDFSHLANLLGVKTKYLASVVASSHSHYRAFKIPKESGGLREIQAPFPALKDCQRWILNNILYKIKIHPVAQGYVKKRSIITNAKVHLGQTCFLKIDIQDFFPSITFKRVVWLFNTVGYMPRVSYYLACICTANGGLVQGAPTSPAISNIICQPLDHRIFLLCKSLGLKYSRYADDIAISGDTLSGRIVDYVQDILQENEFKINDKKTFIQKGSGKRIITGISIAGKKLAIPKSFKRTIRQEIYELKKFGLSGLIEKRKIKHHNYLAALQGKLGFWLQVEKKSSFAKENFAFIQSLIENKS